MHQISAKSNNPRMSYFRGNEFVVLSYLRFLSTKVLQGSVATCVNYSRIFIDSFTANLLQSVKVKEF